MARYFDGSQEQGNSKTKRQQEDQRRMEFRRAIESYSEQRRLLQEISDFPDLDAFNYWQAASAGAQKNVQPGR
ncbi:hypothetical protein PMM47T1_06616 [Pseudomonas sp. M47T1]|uniref:PA3496 family putative envelope integrity protein n=1 Tax=unclassified Pseudomonas TaxID=196821 RepID=UPI0002607FB3|nr:hypothetical protein [Pseudomonas sp. M47T1]EIK97436.1 hypothetical protein PMM47T1_06616 [Pseudomonas sp. M47T1]